MLGSKRNILRCPVCGAEVRLPFGLDGSIECNGCGSHLRLKILYLRPLIAACAASGVGIALLLHFHSVKLALASIFSAAIVLMFARETVLPFLPARLVPDADAPLRLN